MVQDFIDGIGEWFDKQIHDLLKSGIEWMFESISDVLQNTYTSATGGLLSTFLTKHPAQFTGTVGNAGGGYGVWYTIEGLCNNVVVPIAGFILSLVLINDLIQMILQGNNLKDFDDTIFIKWIIKSVCGILLVSNTFYIASGLFSFGTDVCANGIGYLLGGAGLRSVNTEEFSKALDDYENGQMLIMLLIAFVVLVAIFLLTVVIILVMASRMIEVFMYLGVSPIPMATLMNNEWGQIGRNWLKGILALSFQGFFIVIALGIFKTIFNSVVMSIAKAEDGVIMSLLMLAGYTAALIFTVLRTGNISRSVFNVM